jgi:hypothetical protein
VEPAAIEAIKFAIVGNIARLLFPDAINLRLRNSIKVMQLPSNLDQNPETNEVVI